MSIDFLFTDFDRLIQSAESVHRLRRFILDLAVRGKLVPQDPNDEPASELLKRIEAEKARLVRAGEIKKNRAKSRKMADASFKLPVSWKWTAIGDVFLYDAGLKRENPEFLIRGNGYWNSKILKRLLGGYSCGAGCPNGNRRAPSPNFLLATFFMENYGLISTRY